MIDLLGWLKNWMIETVLALTAALLVRPILKGRKGIMEDKKEVEGKIGSGGTYSVDLQSTGMVKIEAAYAEGALKGTIALELDVVNLFEQLALKSENKVDDALVAMVKGALGR